MKKYSIKKSPLYRLRNKRKLAELLGLEKSFFRNKKERYYKYNEFFIKTGEKKRLISEPNQKLKNIQKRLNRLFSRITTPFWLYSGIKGKSYIGNAIKHKNSNYLVKIDIKDFYPNCKIIHLKESLEKNFLMTNDIAWEICYLTTYEGYLPQGSPTSLILSYWTYKDLFDEIAEISNKNNITVTLYVDDITFSSKQPITSNFLNNIEEILNKKGLEIKKSKTKYYKPDEYKKVTGVTLNEGSVKVPNKLRYEIITMFKIFLTSNSKRKKEIYPRLNGKINSARQIEPDIFPEIYNRLKKYKF